MKLTIKHRLKLCFEILTIRSGHKGLTAVEKNLSTFTKGYEAGLFDKKLETLHDQGDK